MKTRTRRLVPADVAQRQQAELVEKHRSQIEWFEKKHAEELKRVGRMHAHDLACLRYQQKIELAKLWFAQGRKPGLWMLRLEMGPLEYALARVLRAERAATKAGL